MVSSKFIVIRLLLLLVLLMAAWRMLSLGMSEHYVAAALSGDQSAVDKALSWHGNHPKALYIKAMQVKGERPDQAITLLQQTIDENPAEGRALIELAHLLREKNELERADRLAEQSVKLMPALVPVRMQAANYWVLRDQWDKAMENWRAALITDGSLGSKIYPIMLQMVESDEARPLMKAFTDDPPSWWDAFFKYTAKETSSVESLISLSLMRRASKAPVSEDERKYLVDRLLKEQQWSEAYLVWINGLSTAQRKYMGGVYNGGFEQEISSSGFDWHLPNLKKDVNVGRQSSYGTQGDKALHLIFRNKEFRFRHLYQRLFRSVGEHEFTGLYRADRLRGRGGLKWAIYCAGDESKLLGESDVMLGLGEWEPVKFRFSVPADAACMAQTLRLESTGRTTFDHKLEGDIWLDALSIRYLGPIEESVTVLEEAASN